MSSERTTHGSDPSDHIRDCSAVIRTQGCRARRSKDDRRRSQSHHKLVACWQVLSALLAPIRRKRILNVRAPEYNLHENRGSKCDAWSRRGAPK